MSNKTGEKVRQMSKGKSGPQSLTTPRERIGKQKELKKNKSRKRKIHDDSKRKSSADRLKERKTREDNPRTKKTRPVSKKKVSKKSGSLNNGVSSKRAKAIKSKNRKRIVRTTSKLGRKKNAAKRRKYFRNVSNKRLAITIISSFFLSAILIGLIAIGLRYRLAIVGDEAMTPVIEQGQALIVDSKARIRRYDIVSFRLSSSEFSGEYVQRIIGIPGDSIWVESNAVFVNGSLDEAISLRPQSYASQLPSGTFSFSTDQQTVIEELRGFSNIPADSYLVLTDEKTGPADSRVFGLVNQRNIQGVVTYRLWPFMELGDI